MVPDEQPMPTSLFSPPGEIGDPSGSAKSPKFGTVTAKRIVIMLAPVWARYPGC